MKSGPKVKITKVQIVTDKGELKYITPDIMPYHKKVNLEHMRKMIKAYTGAKYVYFQFNEEISKK